MDSIEKRVDLFKMYRAAATLSGLAVVGLALFARAYYEFRDPLNRDLWLIGFYLIVIWVAMRVYQKVLRRKWYYPFPLTVAGFSVYYIFGILVYYVRDSFFYNWSGDIGRVNNICFIAILSMIAAYFFVSSARSMMKGGGDRNPLREAFVSRSRLSVLMNVLAVLGFFSALLLFDFFREVPILSDKIDIARTEMTAARGKYFPGVVLLVHAVAISWYLYLTRKRTGKGALLAFLMRTAFFAFPLFLYGGRFLMLFPVLVCTIMYIEYRKFIHLYKIVPFFSLLFAVSMVYVGYRIYGTRTDTELIMNGIIGDLFPEMRGFAAAIVRMDIGRYFGQVYLTPLVGLFPSFLLNVIGVPKADYWQPIGKAVLDAMNLDNIPGIRISLLGEIYLAGGYFLVILTMCLLGVVLSWADAKLENKAGFEKYPYLVLACLFPLSMAYGSSFIPIAGFIFLESMVIVWIVKGKEQSTEPLQEKQ